MLASSAGHAEVVKWLLGSGQAHVDFRTWDGMTALMLACAGDHQPVARCLVEHGAKIDSVDEVAPLANIDT